LANICKDASSKGVELILFPEAYLPCYPHGGTLGMVFGHHGMEGRKIFQMWWDSAVEIPGPAVNQLSEIAKENKLFLVVGVIEKDGGTLYCTVVFFGNDGTYLGKHRKLMPTAIERITWGQGDGSTMPVFDTPIGKVGAVICWENYMPLLRTTMYSKGIQIYCAPTADNGHNWQATMKHIALEGRCFVLGCCQFTRRSDYPPETEYPTDLDNKDPDAVLSKGGSVIISPLGEILAGPNFVGEELLVADLDLNEVTRGKFDLDVVGHYARPDVFTLHVNEKPNPGVTYNMKQLKISEGNEMEDQKDKE